MNIKKKERKARKKEGVDLHNQLRMEWELIETKQVFFHFVPCLSAIKKNICKYRVGETLRPTLAKTKKKKCEGNTFLWLLNYVFMNRCTGNYHILFRNRRVK